MTEPSKEAMEVAKDIRQEWMRIALTEGKELALPAGHLALMATHLDRFAAQRVAEIEKEVSQLVGRYEKLSGLVESMREIAPRPEGDEE